MLVTLASVIIVLTKMMYVPVIVDFDPKKNCKVTFCTDLFLSQDVG